MYAIRSYYAISIYDLKNNSLQLWRDPLGIKPLYYHCSDKYVIFASELKMIYAVLDKKPTLDFAAIDHILKYRLQPGCTTVFNEIQKVLPGETIIFKNKKAVVITSYSIHYTKLYEGIS